MLTSVQKEILQNLINLYQTSEGKSIKGEDIAEVMNRNPGTIRNQMQSLRSLSLVKGVPGPRGGYKPTIEAYHSLNIPVTDNLSKVSIYKDDKKLDDLSVAKIEFTSVPHPGECEAVIKILGSIKDLNLGDTVRIGPTPVNNLGVIGKIVGRDDIDNIILLDTTTIRSIPKKTVKDVASLDLIYLNPNFVLKDAAAILSENSIDGAPVIEDNKVLGMLTLTDLAKALADGEEGLKVNQIMSQNISIVNEDMKLANAIDLMYKQKIGRLVIQDEEEKPIGIITRSDLIKSISNFEKFPLESKE
ncbi:CBS domain-containing protein [Methanobrevibacter sp. OttesenSCG-928-K11]|nr:CBS domain-containing protein [Methanobrevibacter sp. OttesenSCG-928-K11]MDL2271365.1 CBS domain-containing protein [Methanobrevibacter sp. OttesenSCG-928-I08]